MMKSKNIVGKLRNLSCTLNNEKLVVTVILAVAIYYHSSDRSNELNPFANQQGDGELMKRFFNTKDVIKVTLLEFHG